MGAVFRAHDTMLDRTVAVKVLSKVQSNDEETLRRFKNEAQSAARLDHENIGRVHYVDEDKGWHYIVFEFIEGINLRDLVDRVGPLPLADAISYTLQISDALAHAARRDVVHRDIKPSNVLITPEGRAKLVDMGLARLHQVEHSANDLTASGVTLGTFDYISPEQARDPRNADVRSDIYSLGCTVYFMLTGRPPFPEGTVLQKLLQHQSDTPLDVLACGPICRWRCRASYRGCCSSRRTSAYQLPEDLMADLLAVANKFGLTPPTTSTVLVRPANVTAAPLLFRHLPWLAPLAALVAISVGLAIASRPSDVDIAPPPIHRSPAAAALHTVGSATDKPVPDGASAGATASPEAVVGPAATNDAGSKNAIAAGAPAARTETEGPVATANRPWRIPLALSETNTKTWAEQFFSRLERRLHALVWGESLVGFVPTTSPTSLPGLDPRTSSAAGGTSPSAKPASELSEPVIAATETSAPAGRKGLIIVRPNPKSPNELATVREACRAAKSGDVIELRWSGRLEDRPLQLAGQRLTIRAGDGFTPVIIFQPRESDLSQSQSMITLGGGQLTLLGVQLELDVPRQAASEAWSLATIRPGELLRVENCWLTLRNAADSGGALQAAAAIFTISAIPGSGMMATVDAPTGHPPATVQLKNAIVRGEATFLRLAESQPLSVTWQNGLLVVSERLLWAGGNPSDPKPQGQMQLDLRHLTASTQVGFVQIACSQDAALHLPLEVNAADSIFIGRPGKPFLEQLGVDDPEDLRKRMAWSGDRNFYQGFGPMWRIVGPAGIESAVQMHAAEWQSFWGTHEIQATFDQVLWQRVAGAESPHGQSPWDFALRSGENPARGAASDGRDAGFQTDQQPLPAADPEDSR